MVEMSKVAVIGAGIMGNGIAQICAQSGFEVNLADLSETILRRALNQIEAGLSAQVKKKKLSSDQAAEVLGRIAVTTSIGDAVGRVGTVIEAVPEDIELKKRIFAELDKLSPADAMLATNTSSLSIGQIASSTGRPQNVIGMHFFYPVPISPAVELVPSVLTSVETMRRAKDFVRSIGKETLVAKDFPGFVTNRLLPVFVNEAFDLVFQGIAEPEEVDRACTLILGHPVGPLRMADMVGLDTVLAVVTHLHEELGERYLPSPLLRQLVNAGHYGGKTGKGVYDYNPGEDRPAKDT
ncbi:MAG: 3-hydroxyacyl-CoA dehydrogenase family protein [Deltaproteobacteria bacterium]